MKINTKILGIVILVVALMVVGIVLMTGLTGEPVEKRGVTTPTEEVTSKEEIPKEKLDYDDLLNKMFPNNKVKDGKVETEEDIKIYLDKVVEGFFIKPDEKNLLFIVQMTGVSHAGGLYHAFLGLFDASGKLLTLPIVNPLGGDPGDLIFRGLGHVGADSGNFAFYDCSGIKYILFAKTGCTTGGCSGAADLVQIQEGKFEIVQSFGYFEDIEKFIRRNENVVLAAAPPQNKIEIMVKPEENGLVIYKKVEVDPDFVCSAPNCLEEFKWHISTYSQAFIYLNTLYWNKDACRFEKK